MENILKMKFAICGLFLSAALLYVAAQEKDELKIYKRLIPADVLRGECTGSDKLHLGQRARD